MLFFALNDEARDSAGVDRRRTATTSVTREPFVPGGVNNQTAGFINGLCSYDRDEIRQLAARKTVEHTLHGNINMITGWPDDVLPPSYAHVAVGAGDVRADRRPTKQAMADSLLEAGFVMAGTPEDCAPVLDAFQEVGRRPGHHPHADG